MKKITIKFIHPYPPYNRGESATFYEKEANRLTDRGFAVYVGGDAKLETQADRLKALRGAQTQAIRTAPQNQAIQGPSEATQSPQPSRTAPNKQSIETKGKPATAKTQGGKNKGPRGRSNSKSNKTR